MASVIAKKAVTYADKYVNEDIRQVLNDHVRYILENGYDTLVLEALAVIRWQCDFYGLLASMGISGNMHYIVARLNGLTCSQDDFSTMTSIYVPTEAIMKKIVSRQLTSNKK